MKLHTSDLLIICAYLIAMIVIGLILKKRAAQNMDSYFLGGKSLPFYMLGLSNASGMFDITGTMLMVYWAFAYGFKMSLDSLAMAGIQSDIPHGLSVGMVAAFQCAHRSRMDQNPLR